jgi:hypothetical protein
MEGHTPTSGEQRDPRCGDVFRLGAAASCQFRAQPILFRVIRVQTRDTYIGWIWLDGYEINEAGDAVERRSVFVQIAGLVPVRRATPPGRNPSAVGARNQRRLPERQRGSATGARTGSIRT